MSSIKAVKKIDDEVWKPFIKAYNTRNQEDLKKVHSKDFIRVVQDNNQIFGYETYFAPKPDSIKAKRAAWQRDIELRFTQRIASENEAFDVGYYKVIYKNSDTGESRTSYGKFHFLLRKEEGKWKILMDADAHEETTEEIFLSAEAMIN